MQVKSLKCFLPDAELILKLLVEKRFPAIWMLSKELLDLRALLLHRHQWVQTADLHQMVLHRPIECTGLIGHKRP